MYKMHNALLALHIRPIHPHIFLLTSYTLICAFMICARLQIYIGQVPSTNTRSRLIMHGSIIKQRDCLGKTLEFLSKAPSSQHSRYNMIMICIRNNNFLFFCQNGIRYIKFKLQYYNTYIKGRVEYCRPLLHIKHIKSLLNCFFRNACMQQK